MTKRTSKERHEYLKHMYRTISMPKHEIHFRTCIKTGEVCLEFLSREEKDNE